MNYHITISNEKLNLCLALEMLKRGLNDLKYLTEVAEKKFLEAEQSFIDENK